MISTNSSSFIDQKLKVIYYSSLKPKPIVKIKIAPRKYFPKHFKEIDKLIKKGYKINKAVMEVAEKYNFKYEGFYKQYNKYLNGKIKLK